MRLVLLRHGIAIERDHPECPPDPERFLTAQGQQRARQAVQGLRRLKIAPDTILTSPWRRAMETTEICVDVLGLDPSVVAQRDDLLPGADPSTAAEHVESLDEDVVLVVGHAPHLDRLLARLVGDSTEPMSSLKKSGAASIVLGGGAGGTILEWLATPRMLRRLGRS